MTEKDPFYDTPSKGLRRDQNAPRDDRPLRGLAQGSRGNTVIISPFDAAGTLQTGGVERDIVFTGNNNGDEAELIGITLGLETSPDPTLVSTEPYPVSGLIEWGIGGAQFSAEVDWDNGKTLAVLANYVRVKATYTPIAPLGAGSPPSVAVSAAVSYGAVPRSSSGQAKFTKVIPTMAVGGQSSITKVPNFATGLTLASENGSPDFQVWFMTASAAFGNPLDPLFNITVVGQYRWCSAQNDSQQGDGVIMIPAGARYFAIKNGGIVPTAAHAIFTLNL